MQYVVLLRHYVTFCDEPPDPATLPDPELPEQLAVNGREIYTACPDGMRDSVMMATLSRKQPTPVTTNRNWNTVEKLVAMLAKD